MKTRILQIAVLISTLIVLGVNWYAATGAINNTTPKQISDKFTTEITPAGYAFAIWSLIYLGLIAFSVFQLLPSQKDHERVSRIRIPYLISCAANIGWIVSWHYELIPLSMLFMIMIFGSLLMINLRLMNPGTWKEVVFARATFGIYFGWVTAATILNITILLVYLGVQLSPVMTAVAGVLVIVVATAIGIFVRFKLEQTLYPVALAWALTAIGVEQSGDTAVVTATAFGMMALLFASLWGYIKDK